MSAERGIAVIGYVAGGALVISAVLSAEDHFARGTLWPFVPLMVGVLGTGLIALPTSPGLWALASLFFAAGFGYNVGLAVAGWAECGCLGPLSLPPKWMATLDLLMCGATSLLAWVLRKSTQRASPSVRTVVAGLVGATALALLLREYIPVRKAILFIPQRVDLGVVYYDEIATQRIIAYNPTKEALSVVFKAGCPCVSVSPAMLEIPPRKGVPVVVKVDPRRARQPPETTLEVPVWAHDDTVRRVGAFLIRVALGSEPAD